MQTCDVTVQQKEVVEQKKIGNTFSSNKVQSNVFCFRIDLSCLLNPLRSFSRDDKDNPKRQYITICYSLSLYVVHLIKKGKWITQ